MHFQVIGLSGHAGSGKDFIGKTYLRPLGFYQFSMAWPLKVNVIGKKYASFEEVFRTKPAHVRTLLQLEGTEKGRMVFGDDVWCETVYTWFTLLNEEWGINRFYIPDVRFPNELQFVRNMNGIVIRISAPEREKAAGLSDEARKHISETALDSYTQDDFDGWINNDPKDDVESQLIEILKIKGIVPMYFFNEQLLDGTVDAGDPL